jgi:hypothetical protein
MRWKLVLRGESPVNNRVNGSTSEMPMKQSHSHTSIKKANSKKVKCENPHCKEKHTHQIPSERRREGQKQPAHQETAKDTVVAPYILKIVVKSE